METGTKNTSALHKLTALWALCESGLGGWMHAIKLPFTGFLLGAFSIIIIALIAFNTGNSFKKIIQATIIVILIKAAVSPQSSPAAYFAVGFQGLAGAVIFKFVNFRIAAVLVGVITMLESALQMVIIKTVIFGMALWEAIDLLFGKVTKQFHLDTNISFSIWIIGSYLLLYATWGLILGLWIGRLPQLIELRKVDILAKIKTTPSVNDDISLTVKKRSKQKKIISTLLILVFITAVYMAGQYNNGLNKTVYVIIRTIAIITLFYWVINPLIRWLMQQWLSKNKKDALLYSVMSSMADMKLFVRPAFALAKQYSGLKKYKAFILALLILTLYSDNIEKK